MRRAPQEGQKAAPLARKRDQLLMGALAAAQAEKPVREDAAFEKGIGARSENVKTTLGKTARRTRGQRSESGNERTRRSGSCLP